PLTAGIPQATLVLLKQVSSLIPYLAGLPGHPGAALVGIQYLPPGFVCGRHAKRGPPAPVWAGAGLLAWPWPENAGAGGTIDNVPELPEVESLAVFLRERAAGQVIDRADSAAISVLKTYQPDLTALRGRVIDGVQRHGKFLDLSAVPGDGQPPGAPLHLVMHLARAGWLRWREDLPAAPPRPGKGPLGFRLRFTD